MIQSYSDPIDGYPSRYIEIDNKLFSYPNSRWCDQMPLLPPQLSVSPVCSTFQTVLVPGTFDENHAVFVGMSPLRT